FGLSFADLLRTVEQFVFVAVTSLAAALAVFVRGLHKGGEQRLRLERLGLELRMELAADEVRMVIELDDLDVGSVGSRSRYAQAGAGQHRFILAVELVAVAMAFADLRLAAVDLGSERAGGELADPGAEAHGATEFIDAAQFAQLVDDEMRGRGIELAGVGTF